MIWEPIEKRYSLSAMRDRQMLCSAAFAIAAGVIGVGATAAGTAISMSAADRAAKAQGAAGKKYKQQLAKATKQFSKQQQELRQQVQAIDPTINIPEYNLQNATLEGIESANKVTANTLLQLEKVAPGSTQARQQVGQIIGGYLRGEIPRDVQEQTMRSIAEFAGAGFNAATAGRVGGFQAAQGLVPRQALLTSFGIQREGVNMAASWQQTAGSFIKDPAQMMALGLQGRGQDINIAQANIRNRMAQAEMIGQINLGQYNALTGQAQAGYGVAQQGIESTLAARQAVGSGIQDTGTSVVDAYGGYLGATRQLSLAQGGVNPANYERIYGKAIPVGGQTTAGFGNFDYGV
jgi:hypothetical protein